MPRAARTVLPQVGALIEGPALYGFLSGRDNLLRYDSPPTRPPTRAPGEPGSPRHWTGSVSPLPRRRRPGRTRSA
ncbi:hypothetical protein GCM10017687_35140 [Streptomyces echinatus]